MEHPVLSPEGRPGADRDDESKADEKSREDLQSEERRAEGLKRAVSGTFGQPSPPGNSQPYDRA